MTLPDIKDDIREVPVSVLAYIGDAVYELYVRLHFYGIVTGHSGTLHRKSIDYVRASAQAKAARQLMPFLTAEETAIFRRGRNSQASSMSKNADPADYQAATGFEALVGFLYLMGETKRMEELFAMIFEGNVYEKKI